MTGPLSGVRVLELGSLIAGPFATRVLADLGAEVLKIEPPGGDPLRSWGQPASSGWSWWSYVQNRGKYLACADLTTEGGRRIVHRLLGKVDVVVQNFRPSTAQKWGLGPQAIADEYPNLVYVALSGFGLSGPKADQPGFGNVAEALGGLRYVTGEPDGPPMRTGVSIGDTLASLYGVIGALASLFARERDIRRSGEIVDVALTEAVFSVLEATVTEYFHAGIVRERSGNRLERSAPSSIYQTKDEKWCAVAGNSDAIFRSLSRALGLPELATDPRFTTNRNRVATQSDLDQIIGDWIGTRSLDEVLSTLEAAGVPAGPIQSVADIVRDPQFLARGMFMTCADSDLGDITMPAPVPRFVRREHRPKVTGGTVGRDTGMIARWLELDDEEYKSLVHTGALVDAHVERSASLEEALLEQENRRWQ